MKIDAYIEQPIIKEYNSYLRLERSLSDNTRAAYLEDLAKLLGYLEGTNIDIQNVQREHLENFLIDLSDLGITPRSRARIISGIKSFYQFLLMTDKREDDPTELLEMPQIGKHLPEVLSIEEIDAMESKIDLTLPQGHRNKAIIEVLYSCGLRVSEDFRHLLRRAVYHSSRKGKQTALGPYFTIGYQVYKLLVGRPRQTEHKERLRGLCLFEPPGGTTQPYNGVQHHKGTGGKSRNKQNHQSTHAAPLFCDPPAGRRRQSSRYSRNARTQINTHH